jgi:hypothetical protein
MILLRFSSLNVPGLAMIYPELNSEPIPRPAATAAAASAPK